MERKRVQAVYNFGSVVTIGVYKDDSITWNEAVKNYSEDIDGFINPDTGKYEEITKENQEGEEMEERRTTEEIKEEIKNYFEENEDDFNEVIEDLDSWNGYLGDNRYYNMEELDELYNGTEPTEILTRAFYGYDEMYTNEDGSHPEPFNPNRDYFRYNGYGNLVSTDIKDYSDHLDNYFIDAVIENAHNLYELPDEVQELLDELETIEA